MLNKLGDILTKLKELLRKLERANPLTRQADDVNVSSGRTPRRPRDGNYEGIWA
jgi:hypothetical protein